MFNKITGKITGKEKERIFISTGAIEWDIFTTAVSLQSFPSIGEETSVYTYLYHKEDQLKLFGFYSQDERTLFMDLIKVDGVGPKLAMKILSGISTNDFIEALESENLERLSAIPGLGKKTAQKIVLKLKGKLTTLEKPWDPIVDDIVNALVGMGFDKKASIEAVKASLANYNPIEMEREDLERVLFKTALGLLSANK